MNHSRGPAESAGVTLAPDCRGDDGDPPQPVAEPLVEWVQDPSQRELTGWYLDEPGQKHTQLDVHAMVDALGRDEVTDAESWSRSATAVRALTEALASSRAEGIQAGNDPADPCPTARAFELFVSVCNGGARDHGLVLTAILDEAALRLMSRRVRARGGRLLGFSALPDV